MLKLIFISGLIFWVLLHVFNLVVGAALVYRTITRSRKVQPPLPRPDPPVREELGLG